GVMVAASFWSLLDPAIAIAEELDMLVPVIISSGFFLGGILIICADKILSKYGFGEPKDSNSPGKGSLLLTIAVTLHNIPEGLAVGVAFGSVTSGAENATLIGAVFLSIGIGLQNFPEGACVSLPLRAEGVTRRKSFFYGQVSGMVEPVSAVIGAALAMLVKTLLPFLLSFSAGAMIAVVASELIPESARQNKNLGTIGVTVGFILMMVLDTCLG
ncbi:MAG: ZIP family metal transporter, partial [Clostridiales bacterium]|nr:ZIP family metal transporter [Clostridiales bacterium]